MVAHPTEGAELGGGAAAELQVLAQVQGAYLATRVVAVPYEGLAAAAEQGGAAAPAELGARIAMTQLQVLSEWRTRPQTALSAVSACVQNATE